MISYLHYNYEIIMTNDYLVFFYIYNKLYYLLYLEIVFLF